MSVIVWTYATDASGASQWTRRPTTARAETSDELRFWRVIDTEGAKHFFFGPHDYCAFSGQKYADLPPESLARWGRAQRTAIKDKTALTKSSHTLAWGDDESESSTTHDDSSDA